MKRTNVNIYMWDAIVTIPLQMEFLQKELENMDTKNQLPREENETNLVQPIKGGETSKKNKASPLLCFLDCRR